MMEEALAYIRAMLAEEPSGYIGEFYTLESFGISPRPIGPVPLIVGGTGKVKTPRLAGRYADEYNAYPAPPDVFRAKVAAAREAAVDAGRDPNDLLISSSGSVIAAPTQAEYAEKLAARAAEAQMTVDELEAHFEHRQTPRGTYAQVAAILADMEAAGMQRFYLQLGADFDREETADLLDALSSA
jgi:alkanesulfonate monooxygenase SsuD/methylene tetrahydromethanopterin reductase-like flavin-dependent oxidoreductase (luciferase family)